MSCIKHSVSTGWTIVGQTPRWMHDSQQGRCVARPQRSYAHVTVSSCFKACIQSTRNLIHMRSENYKKVRSSYARQQANRSTSHRYSVEFYHMARSFRSLLISVPLQTYLCSFPLVVCIHAYIFFIFFFFKKGLFMLQQAMFCMRGAVSCIASSTAVLQTAMRAVLHGNINLCRAAHGRTGFRPIPQPHERGHVVEVVQQRAVRYCGRR